MHRHVLSVVLVGIAAAPAALGQRQWSLEEVARRFPEQNGVGAPGAAPDVLGNGFTPLGTGSYLDELPDVVAFLDRLQRKDPSDPEFGGMEEAEHLPFFVETDNTTEAVWVWSFHRQVSGDLAYVPNVADAWVYILNHPAWTEGGSGPNYYSMYNCGWALIAEPLYRQVTGDASFLAYARTCADYVVNNPLSVTSLLDRFSEGFALGALHRFGTEQGDPAYTAWAATRSQVLLQDVLANPSQLGLETWALSGGTLFWGLLTAAFPGDPAGARAFARSYDGWLDLYDPSGSWNTAHNHWYMLAHFASWQARGAIAPKAVNRSLLEFLLAQDGDQDGGIPAQETDGDDQDQSWVTNYLAFMGIEPDAPSKDVEAAPDRNGVPASGGTLKLDVGASNNLAATDVLWLLGFLNPPAGPPLFLGFLRQTLPARSEQGFQDLPLTFPAGTQPGTWSISLFAYDGMPDLADTDTVAFTVQ